MRPLRIIAAWIFLFLSMEVVIPAQLWHELSGHDDSKECVYSGEVQVSEQHIHCLALELTLPGMLQEVHHLQFKNHEVVRCFISADIQHPALQALFSRGDRGPPAVNFYC
jgi:hypothetical protein